LGCGVDSAHAGFDYDIGESLRSRARGALQSATIAGMPSGLSISHDSHGKCIDRAIEGQLARIAERVVTYTLMIEFWTIWVRGSEQRHVERFAAVRRFIGGPIQEKVLAILVEALEQRGR
jgi:hypothetical protein